MRRAAETMVEALFVVDREAGRLFVMEGAAGLILAAGAGDLHGAADEGRQGDARAEFVEPLRGEGHSDPLPLAGGVRGGHVREHAFRSEEHTSELQSIMR